MDVLFVVPYVPNLVRTRPYNLIRALTARGHRLTVLTLWANESETADLDILRQMVHQVHALPMPAWRSLLNCLPALFSGMPLQTVFSWQPELVRDVNGRSPYDVVHVEHLRGARYALTLKKQTNLPVVWDSVDCITHLFRQAAVHSKNPLGRWRSRFELQRTRHYESWLQDKVDQIVVTSNIDKQQLAGLRPDLDDHIDVLPNGVDLDYFRPNESGERHENTIVVSGKMSYHANVSMVLHLVQNIMPHVWQQRPQVQLQVVGKDPVREIQALAANPNITVTGTVPELRPYLQQATVAVTPIVYGAGVQNKVLEALACGTPVVTAPKAIAALDIEPERDVLVAAKPETFARHILSLLADPQRQRRLSLAGRAYVEAHHDWDKIAASLENIYQTAIDKHTAVVPTPLPVG